MAAERAGDARALVTDTRLLSVLSVTVVAILSNQAAPVALPGIGSSLGVSDARVGLVITAFFLPASVMMLVVGVLADVYGRRRVVLPSLALFGASGVAVLFVDSFLPLLALRALQGATFPALTPLSTAIIGDLYDGPTGTTAQGLRSSANGIAGIVGPAVAGVLAGVAWQYPFVLAAASFPALAFAYVALPETLGPAERGRSRDEGFRGHLRGLLWQFVDPNLRLLAVGAGVVYFVKFAVVTFIPLLAVRTLGASPFEAGLLLSVRGAVRIVAAPLSGAAVATFSRKTSLVGTLVLVGASTVALPFVPSLLSQLPSALPGVPVLVALAVLMAGYSAGEALFNPVLNDTVVGIAAAERRASVVTGISTFKNVASAASPPFFGAVLALGGFEALFAVAAAIPVAFAGVLLVRFDVGSADAPGPEKPETD